MKVLSGFLISAMVASALCAEGESLWSENFEVGMKEGCVAKLMGLNPKMVDISVNYKDFCGCIINANKNKLTEGEYQTLIDLQSKQMEVATGGDTDEVSEESLMNEEELRLLDAILEKKAKTGVENEESGCFAVMRG